MSRILTTARQHAAATTAIALVGIALVGWLAWLFQPWQLFLDTEVDEAFPVVTTAPASPASSAPSPALPAQETVPVPTEAPTEPPGEAPSGAPAEPAEPAGPVLLADGSFQDRSHPTTGAVGIHELPDGSRILRIEDLSTDNGPDLFVYLSAAPADAPSGDFDDTFVNLGRLKGNVGSQNYELPADVDLSAYASVVIWCDRFDVVFGAADLSPA